jgi:two-component sensor histidine kinase
LYFDIDTASSLGLILNELFTNSFKYATKKGKDLEVEIEVRKDEARNFYCLTYSDNGEGLPEHVNIRNGKSLGLRLINMISKQLGGELNYRYDDGAVFEVSFKDNKLRSKIE